MKTRIIIEHFSALAFKVSLQEALPDVAEHEAETAAAQSSPPRPSDEPAGMMPGSVQSAPVFVSGAGHNQALKFQCEAYGGRRGRTLESRLVEQPLPSRPRLFVLTPPAGLASPPAGGPDFSRQSHDDESAHHR